MNSQHQSPAPSTLPACDLRATTGRADLYRCRHTGVRTPGHLVTGAICAACTVRTVSCRRPRSATTVASLVQRGWNMVRAVKEFVADGAKTVSSEEYQARLAVCDTCDRRQGNNCLECGCHLTIKARGRTFRCPLDKWPKSE